MSTYQKESHLRSFIKGISWRIIATADTIAVVLLITCISGQCSLENAIKIGFFEFLIKLLVYYLHERIWQFALRDRIVTIRKTLFKSISWRLTATAMTFVIAGTVFESFDKIALYIALMELFTKFVLYYFHERLWLSVPLGRIRSYFFKKED